MDEPVPVRRAVIGCLMLAVLGILVVALIRPAILLFADPGDDSAVVVGSVALIGQGPVERGVVLGRSYGWDGEADAGGGRIELTVIVAPGQFAGASTVAAASPLGEACPVEIGADRLTDCDGREWSLEGLPLDPADPPLDRFPTVLEDGNVVVDFTRTLDQ